MSLAVTIPSTFTISERQRDQLLVSLWIFLTFRPFRYDELILYPMALYFAWAFFRDLPRIFPIIAYSFVFFLFPIWWLLSMLWGVETELIFKSGLQLFLTIIICYCMATRLTTKDLILAVFIASSIYGVASFVVGFTGSGVAARGVFSSKNAMGFAAVMMWFTSLTILISPDFTKVFRRIALLALLIAGWQINVSNSATAVLLAGGITSLILAFGVLPKTGVFSRMWFYTAIFLFVSAIFWGLAGVMAFNEIDPITAVLDAFGKDATLTGRTVLWNYAEAQIRQNPLLGVGAGGFWTPYDGLSDASRIYVEFHKQKFAHFSFHNSYYEIAVHQGLIGLAIVLLTVFWALALITRSLFSNDRDMAIFFLCVTAVVLVRSMTEAGLLAPFSLLSMLFLTGALMTIRDRILKLSIE